MTANKLSVFGIVLGLSVFGIVLGASAMPASSGMLLDQPHDYLDYQYSYDDGGGLQVGDDYVIASPVLLQSATFWMVSEWPVLPFLWSFDIYEHSTNDIYGEGPAFLPSHRAIGASTITDLGQWNDEPDRHLFEVTFENLNIVLEPGTWWISPEGWVTDSNETKTYWGTANGGVKNWDEGWVKWEPFNYPGWRPLSYTGTIDPSDYAMRLEGLVIPGPGGLGMFVLAGIAGARRRRRGS